MGSWVCKRFQVLLTLFVAHLFAHSLFHINKLFASVTYWPSTHPSIKKQVHPVEDITLTCGRVEIGAIATPTGSRWMSNNYITRCHRQFELVGVSCSWSQLVGVQFQSQLPVEWEPAPDRGLGPSGPRLSSPTEWGRSAAIVRGTWSQYVAVFSVSNSPLTQ